MNTGRSKLFLAIVGALLAIGCGGGSSGGGSGGSGGSGGGGGGGGGDTPQQPEAKLSISYSALTAKVGDTVTLTARLENSTSPVAWALSGPGALSASSGDEVAFKAEAVGDAAVTAAAAGLTASVKIKCVPGPDPATTMDITGKILNRAGDPVVNQAVFIVDSPALPVHTDGDGSFTISDVTPPYDLATVDDAASRVYIYRGLTSPNPIVYVFTQFDQTTVPARASTTSDAVRGGSPIAGVKRLGFISPQVNPILDTESVLAFNIPGIPAPIGNYMLNVQWTAPETTTTGNLVGLQMNVDPGSGAPFEYWYDVERAELMNGQFNLAGPLLDLRPAATANTQGEITLPAAYTLVNKLLALNFAGGLLFPIFTDPVGQLDFSYVAPDIAEARVQVCASAASTTVQAGFSTTCIDALDPESSGDMLEVLAAPEQFAPANGANDVVDDTTFSWTEFTGGVHLVRIFPTTAGLPTYFIFTDGTSTTVPDLPQVALNFAAGTYVWSVTGFAPFASIDAFAARIPPAAVGQFLNPFVPTILPPVPSASVGTGQNYAFTHVGP